MIVKALWWWFQVVNIEGSSTRWSALIAWTSKLPCDIATLTRNCDMFLSWTVPSLALV